MNYLTLTSFTMLVTVWVLWMDAPRQARRLAARTPAALRPASENTTIALERELCVRLRLAAVGGGIGVVIVAVPLLLRGIAGEGPEGLTAVATVLSSTVVTAVATEAAAVLRRTPRRSQGPRTAALTPRAAHDGRAETGAELVLAALAIAAFALGVSLVTRGIDGGAGAVGAGAGALVVIVVCAFVRRTFIRHPVAATTADDLAVRSAAGAVTTDRFSENLVASGGVLTLGALLVPTTVQGDVSQIIGVVLGAATVAVMAFLVVVRRMQRSRVHA